MPAVSKAQQRFMGMVHAADKGETPASPEVAKASADMKDADAKDFASTKHDGLPDHVKEQLKSVVREVIREKNGMNEMSSNDVHFKNIMKMYDRGGSFTKKKIGAVICKDPKASRKDVEEALFDADYRDITEFEDELGLTEIREKYSSVNEEFKHVIHVDTPTQVVSKPVAAQIMALAKKGVRASEIGLEMGFVGNAKLAADTFQKVKNKIYFELDKRNESVNEAFPTKKVDAKVIADRMRNHKETKGFADKIEKLKMVSAEDLDKMLPDYVDGGVITKIFKESVNEGKLSDTWKKNNKKGYILKVGNIELKSAGPSNTHDIYKNGYMWGKFHMDYESGGTDWWVEPSKGSDFYVKTIDDIVKKVKADSRFNESVNEGSHGMATKLLQSIVSGDSSRAEGTKMSKELAQHYIDWIRTSPFGKKNGNLPLDMLVKASFNWGIERGLDSKLKGELSKLKSTIKESVNEAPQKVGNVNAFGASKVLGKGKKVLGFVADTPNAVATLIQDFPQAMEIEFKQGFFSDGKLLKSIKKGDKVWKELEKRYLDKQTKDAMKAGFSINEEHDCGCNENHDCGCGGVHEHIHEDLSADANGIAGLTASRASAVEDFLEKNNINSNKLYLFLKKGNLKDRMDFVTALVGKPGNPIQKKVISQFSK